MVSSLPRISQHLRLRAQGYRDRRDRDLARFFRAQLKMRLSRFGLVHCLVEQVPEFFIFFTKSTTQRRFCSLREFIEKA